MIKKIDQISIKSLVGFSLLVHIWASYFSTGFQHFDEHFQILEFLNLKWGGILGSQLPWEFHEQIRPWFQSFFYFVISAPFKGLGIENPFFYAWFFRFVTGLIAWFACYEFINVLKVWFKDNETLQKSGYIIMNFLWFAPFVHVRNSSESLSISLFILGSSVFLTKKTTRASLIAGLLWGFTYHARFQMALPVAFIWFHSLIIDKEKHWSKLSFSAIGVMLAIALGTCVDYWGYGKWNFALWNYFKSNILEGKLNTFGESPFYEYIRWGFLRGLPPLSLPLILITVWGWVKKPKHVLTWMTLPYFLLHSYLAHKEVRFLFFCMLISPLFLVIFYYENKEKVYSWWNKKWVRVLTNFALVVNFVALIVASTKPVNPSVNFYSFLWDQKEITKIYAKDESPFTMLGLDIEFYKKPGFEVEVWTENIDEKGKYIFLRKGHEYFEFSKKENCQNLFLAYPAWVLKFNVGNWLSRSRVWSLFKCD